jgi:hypothetical protein
MNSNNLKYEKLAETNGLVSLMVLAAARMLLDCENCHSFASNLRHEMKTIRSGNDKYAWHIYHLALMQEFTENEHVLIIHTATQKPVAKISKS